MPEYAATEQEIYPVLVPDPRREAMVCRVEVEMTEMEYMEWLRVGAEYERLQALYLSRIYNSGTEDRYTPFTDALRELTNKDQDHV